MTDNQAKDHALGPYYRKVLKDIDTHLANMVAIQCSDGNWNYCSYMHGYANGLLLALAIVRQEEPVLKEAPAQWLQNLPARQEPPVFTADDGRTS